MAAEVLTDFPDRFAERRHLFLLDQNGSRRELHLENFWDHKERVILKFAGIDSISDAESLVGGEIQIPAEQRAPLEEGAAYISDLIDCEVFVSDRRPATSGLPASSCSIGKVTDVLSGTGEAPLLQIRAHDRSTGVSPVTRNSGAEYLVPFAQEYIVSVDTAAKRIELNLPEGMLELDAPLTAEEKDAQKHSGS